MGRGQRATTRAQTATRANFFDAPFTAEQTAIAKQLDLKYLCPYLVKFWRKTRPPLVPVPVEVAAALDGSGLIVRINQRKEHLVRADGRCSCGQACAARVYAKMAISAGIRAFQPVDIDEAYELDPDQKGPYGHVYTRQVYAKISHELAPSHIAVFRSFQPRAARVMLLKFEDYRGSPLAVFDVVDGRCSCRASSCWHRQAVEKVRASYPDIDHPLPDDLYQQGNTYGQGDFLWLQRSDVTPDLWGLLPKNIVLQRTCDGGKVQVRSIYGYDKLNAFAFAISSSVTIVPGQPCPCEHVGCVHVQALKVADKLGWDYTQPRHYHHQDEMVSDYDWQLGSLEEHKMRCLNEPEQSDIIIKRTAAGNAALVKDHWLDIDTHRVTFDGRCTCSPGTDWNACRHRAAVAQADWDCWRPRSSVWQSDEGNQDGTLVSSRPTNLWFFNHLDKELFYFREHNDGKTYCLRISKTKPPVVEEVLAANIYKSNILVQESAPSDRPPESVAPANEIAALQAALSSPDGNAEVVRQLEELAYQHQNPWYWRRNIVRFVRIRNLWGADDGAR